MEHDERQREPTSEEPSPGAGTPEAESTWPDESTAAAHAADEPADEQSTDEFETVPAAAPPEPPVSGEERPEPAEPPVSGEERPEPAASPESGEPPVAVEPVEPVEPVASGQEQPADAPPPWPTEPQMSVPADDLEEAVPPSAGPPPSEAEAYVTPPPVEQPDALTQAHSVPATPVGEETQCPRCGTENRPGVAFCRSCGQRLVAPGVATSVARPGAPEGTQQCPRCGTHNRAGVAFCQNCGANLRPIAAPAAGYIPPSVAATAAPGVATGATTRGGAALGPIVLLVGAVGIAAAWLLPFPYATSSLLERSFGSSGGYGIAFWDGYSAVTGGVAGQAYFGFAAPSPILVALLAVLAIAGFLRAAPGSLQRIGLAVAVIWAIGLAALFGVVEVAGGWNGDAVELLKQLTPGGIIFLLASLIVLIGAITRFARS